MKKTLCTGTLIALLSLVVNLAPAVAQTTQGDQDRDRDQDRWMERLQQDPDLDPGLREQMQDKLRECQQLGLDERELDTLFPAGEGPYGPEAMLRFQEQVLSLAREGQPVDLLCAKLDEARMKGAAEPAVTRAMQQMGENLRFAHRYLQGAQAAGIEGPPNSGQLRQLQRGVALDRWRGLQDGEFEQLRDRARDRAQDGSCGLVELCAATETATEMRELGIDSRRAMDLCGEALRQGYSGEELRQMAWMLNEARANGGKESELCDDLREQIRQRARMGDMMEHAMGEGWMGPESMGHGHGGHSPVDDVMGGGHHGEGGMGGNGGGGHGGGDGGGMDGNG